MWTAVDNTEGQSRLNMEKKVASNDLWVSSCTIESAQQADERRSLLASWFGLRSLSTVGFHAFNGRGLPAEAT